MEITEATLAAANQALTEVTAPIPEATLDLAMAPILEGEWQHLAPGFTFLFSFLLFIPLL